MLKTGYQFNRITDLLNLISADAGIFSAGIFSSDTFSQTKVARERCFTWLKIAEGAAGNFPCRRASCSLFCQSNHDQ